MHTAVVHYKSASEKKVPICLFLRKCKCRSFSITVIWCDVKNYCKNIHVYFCCITGYSIWEKSEINGRSTEPVHNWVHVCKAKMRSRGWLHFRKTVASQTHFGFIYNYSNMYCFCATVISWWLLSNGIHCMVHQSEIDFLCKVWQNQFIYYLALFI